MSSPKGRLSPLDYIRQFLACYKVLAESKHQGTSGGPVARAVYHELGSDRPCTQLVTVVVLGLSLLDARSAKSVNVC